MLGALTQLRLYGSRIAALRALRDAEPPDAESEATLAKELSRAAGMAEAAPFLTGERRRDVADAAITALGRDRDLVFRVVFQAGLGALFAAGLAAGGARMTTGLAAFAAFLALPTWVLAVGGPAGLVEAALSAPLGGRAARDLLHARLLTMLALLLGAETDPATAKSVAESLVGTKLPESVIAAALSGGRGFATGKVALRPEAEAALLRGAARKTQAAQLRFRFLILGTAAIGLTALFAGGVRTMRDQGMLPGYGPAASATRTPVDDDAVRDGVFLLPATTGTSG